MKKYLHLRVIRYLWWRRIAIGLGVLTFLLEICLATRSLLYLHLTNGLDAIVPLIGGIIGLCNVLAWWCTPSMPVTSSKSLRKEREEGTLFQRVESKNQLPISQSSLRSLRSSVDTMQSIADSPTQHMAPAPSTEQEWYAFTLSKEHQEERFSQDKFAGYVSRDRCRFAVADGVGSSFLPSRWAELVSRNFVQLPEDFSTPQKFEEWLVLCCQEWENWTDNEWIPRIQQQRGRNYDWTVDRQRGAETTLIGCSFSPLALAQTGRTNVRVTAVGDAVFFLVHPPALTRKSWQHEAFPLTDPREFHLTPQTLRSVEKEPLSAWYSVQQKIYTVYRGDHLFLTTDALAQWILFSIEQGQFPWERLLTLKTSGDFSAFIVEERRNATIELDDTTMLIVLP